MGNQQRAEKGNDYRQEGIQKKLQVDFFPAGSPSVSVYESSVPVEGDVRS